VRKENSMALPKICKQPMYLDSGEQMSITVFPKKQGQPPVDVIQLNLTQIEGHHLALFMTPCEALEMAAGLCYAAQFYLHNQEQYREEILKPREKLIKQRELAMKKKSKALKPKNKGKKA